MSEQIDDPRVTRLLLCFEQYGNARANDVMRAAGGIKYYERQDGAAVLKAATEFRQAVAWFYADLSAAAERIASLERDAKRWEKLCRMRRDDLVQLLSSREPSPRYGRSLGEIVDAAMAGEE